MNSLRLQMAVTLLCLTAVAFVFACRGLPPNLFVADAARNGNLDQVVRAVAWKVDVNLQEPSDGSTALHEAACQGHVEIAVVLADAGADLESNACDGCTPLHFAAWFGHTPIVARLIHEGANVNAIAIDDLTPLHLAAEYGHCDAAMLLVAGHANLEATQLDGKTPRQCAVEKGHNDIATLLSAAEDRQALNR